LTTSWDIRKHTIISDLDGTLVNLFEELQLYLWNRFHTWVPISTITDYDAHKQIFVELCQQVDRMGACPQGLPATLPGLKTLLRRDFWLHPERYFAAKPYYDYWRSLVRWTRRGGQLWFLTARHPALAEATRLWLEKWDLHNCPVYHASNKYAELQILIPPTTCATRYIYIDDRAEDVVKIQEDKKLTKRMQCVLVDAPWNRWADATEPTPMRKSRQEIAELVKEGIEG